jgi:ribosome biogenesis protein YTM1
VRSARWISIERGLIAAAGKNGTNDVLVFHADASSATPAAWSMRQVAVCRGHIDSVESVAPCADGERFATAGVDRSIMLWATPSADALDNVRPTKKQRGASAKSGVATVPLAPLSALDGHTKTVSGIAWPHPAALYSCAWDRTLRMWDVELGRCTATWTAPAVATDVDFGDAANLVATAHHDRVVRVWDPRTRGGAADAEGKSGASLLLRSHKGWVTSVAWSPYEPNHLVSSALDGTVKVWDIRTHVPLHTIDAVGASDAKVFATAWCAGALLSGGSTAEVIVSKF